jgi:hypothetical protein
MAPIWKPSSNQTGFGLHVRGGHEIYGTYTLRRSAWGFGGYPGVGTTYDQNTSFIQYTGIANGRTFNLNHGTTNNTIQPYTHFLVQDCTGHVQLYHLNAEHVHNWPGNFAIENSARVTVYGYKGESNYPSFYVKDTQNFLCFGHGGNPSAYIPSGVYPPGTGPSTPQNPDTGYNPEPVDFPPDYTPALFVLENVDNYRISQTQDEGRNTGGHPVFGLGTRADYWHLGAEYDASVVETLLLPPGARPTIWTKGDVYAEETPVLIGDAEDESFTNGESVTITGSGFEASQGTGRVVISPSNNIAGVGVVTQTVTSWSATSVTITAVRSSLAYNTPLYLFIETDSDVSNASGYVVAFEPIASLSHTLYDEDGDAVTNETSIKASIWRNREPSGAPDQELTGLSTNGSGVITFSIEATGLDPGEPVYMLLYKDHATTWKVGAVKVVPTYS